MARKVIFTRDKPNAVALLHECNIKSFHLQIPMFMSIG